VLDALKRHWHEYLMEAAGLGLFMISAAVFATVLEYPGSLLHKAIPDPLVRRALMGLAMGLTAIGIIYSPWGQQSGSHLNPAVTFTFFRLGKIEPPDALFYIMAQFAGGIAGVLLAQAALGMLIAHPSVNYVVTVPGLAGPTVAFLAEVIISLGLMLVVLIASNTRNLARFTGLFAGLLVATYITVEAPLSGMSMNPARTFGSALPAQIWAALWVYFSAPVLGMLLAGEFFRRLKRAGAVFRAKLHHHNSKRCIFRCRYQQLISSEA